MLKHLLSASCFCDTPRGFLDVNATLQAMLNVSIQSIAPALDKELRLATDLPPLECSPGSINCAFFCLLTNAVRQYGASRNDAAPAGRIVVETALCDHAIQITIGASPHTAPATQAEAQAEAQADAPEDVQERLRLACDILHREHGGDVFVKAGGDRETGYIVILPLDPRTAAPWT